MKKHIYDMVKSQLEVYKGNDYLAEILEDRDSRQHFENEDAIELYSAYLMFLVEEQENDFNTESLYSHLFDDMRNLLDNFSIKFNNNDTENFLKYLKDNYLKTIYLEDFHLNEPINKTEQVDDVKVLNKFIELGAKGTVKELNEITEALSKDITDSEKTSLLVKQNEQIKYLQAYFNQI